MEGLTELSCGRYEGGGGCDEGLIAGGGVVRGNPGKLLVARIDGPSPGGRRGEGAGYLVSEAGWTDAPVVRLIRSNCLFATEEGGG